MKHILLTTIAAVLLVGCGESQQNPIHDTDEVKLVEPVVDDAILEPPATTVTPAQAQPSPPVAEKPVQQPFPTAEVNRSKPVVEPAPPAKIGKELNPETDRALRDAIAKGDIESLKRQLASGVDVNLKAARGWTPLHNSVDSDDKEIVELLIKNGADVNATHNGGGTPLHWAARKGQKEIVELLISNGANVNAQDEDGGTPLFYASNPEIVDLIRKHGGKTGEELKAAGK